MDNLIKPYGGILVDLVLDSDKAEYLKKESQHFPSHTLTQRQVCDLELLMNGGFSPLTGFMTEEIYNSVVADMRLPERQLWPIPITLDVSSDLANKISTGEKLALLAATRCPYLVHITSFWPARSVSLGARPFHFAKERTPTLCFRDMSHSVSPGRTV